MNISINSHFLKWDILTNYQELTICILNIPQCEFFNEKLKLLLIFILYRA